MPEVEYKSPRSGRVYGFRWENEAEQLTQEDYDVFARKVEQIEMGTEQSAFRSFTSAVGQGLTTMPGTVLQGVGAMLGSSGIEAAGKEYAEDARKTIPIDPMRRDDFSTQAGQAVGQAIGQLGLGLATGGGSLGTSLVLGTAAAMGAASGSERAEQSGLTGARRMGRVYGSALTELASERLFGLGSKTFFKPAAIPTTIGQKGLRFAGTSLGEGVEEIAAGVGNNIVDNVTAAGLDIPTPDIVGMNAFKSYAEQGLLGMVGGTVFAGAQLALGSQAAATPVTRAYATVDGVRMDITDLSPTQRKDLGIDEATVEYESILPTEDADIASGIQNKNVRDMFTEMKTNSDASALDQALNVGQASSVLATAMGAGTPAAGTPAAGTPAAAVTPTPTQAPIVSTPGEEAMTSTGAPTPVGAPAATAADITEFPAEGPTNLVDISNLRFTGTPTQTPTFNATLQGDFTENRVEERVQTNEGGTPTEAGRGDILVERGQNEPPVAENEAVAPAPPLVEPGGEGLLNVIAPREKGAVATAADELVKGIGGKLKPRARPATAPAAAPTAPAAPTQTEFPVPQAPASPQAIVNSIQDLTNTVTGETAGTGSIGGAETISLQSEGEPTVSLPAAESPMTGVSGGLGAGETGAPAAPAAPAPTGAPVTPEAAAPTGAPAAAAPAATEEAPTEEPNTAEPEDYKTEDSKDIFVEPQKKGFFSQFVGEDNPYSPKEKQSDLELRDNFVRKYLVDGRVPIIQSNTVQMYELMDTLKSRQRLEAQRQENIEIDPTYGNYDAVPAVQLAEIYLYASRLNDGGRMLRDLKSIGSLFYYSYSGQGRSAARGLNAISHFVRKINIAKAYDIHRKGQSKNAAKNIGVDENDLSDFQGFVDGATIPTEDLNQGLGAAVVNTGVPGQASVPVDDVVANQLRTQPAPPVTTASEPLVTEEDVAPQIAAEAAEAAQAQAIERAQTESRGLDPDTTTEIGDNIFLINPEPKSPNAPKVAPAQARILVTQTLGFTPKNVAFEDTDVPNEDGDQYAGKVNKRTKQITINLRNINDSTHLKDVLFEEMDHLVYADPMVQAEITLLAENLPEDIRQEVRQYRPELQREEAAIRFMRRLEQEPNTASLWKKFVDAVRAAIRRLFNGQLTPRDLKMAADRVAARSFQAMAAQTFLTGQGEGMRYSFAGEQSLQNLAEEKRKFMTDSLDAAKAMAAAGKSSEEIRAVTGWFPGFGKGNEKLRWEIPDNEVVFRKDEYFNERNNDEEARFIVSRFFKQKQEDRLGEALSRVAGAPRDVLIAESRKLAETNKKESEQLNAFYAGEGRENKVNNRVPLGYILDHPALFEAYPELNWVPVSFDANDIDNPLGQGQFSRGTGVIGLSPLYDNNEILSTLLHEVQHVIQYTEGFAIGASPESYVGADTLYKDWLLRAELVQLADETGKTLTEAVESYKDFPEDYRSLKNALEIFTPESDFRDSVKRNISYFKPRGSVNAFDAYYNTAGEYEARDVQARQNLTPEQRKATAPYSSENIAAEDAIVMFGSGGPQMSITPESPDALGMGAIDWISKTDPVNDAMRVGTAKLGTKAVPLDTPQDSNIHSNIVPPELLARQMKVVNYPHLPEDIRLEPDAESKRRKFMDWIKGNLLALHDAFPTRVRARATHWYDGANKIAKRFAADYGTSPEQASGVLAVLSPQKDWFMNVAQGQQVMDIWANDKNTVLTQSLIGVELENIINAATAKPSQLIKAAKNETPKEKEKRQAANDKAIQAAKDDRRAKLAPIVGRTITELDSDPNRQAWAIRILAQSKYGRDFAVITPEGDFLGPVTVKDGSRRMNGWGSSVEIKKAVRILKDGSLENISSNLGNEHKVRNFFNNIIAPNSPMGDATIDTHAVAAAHLMPFGASAIEVGHNFGMAVPGSDPIGVSGLYHLYLDAYTKAAQERGIQPRQLQSITWEAIRQLFPSETRRDKKVVADALNVWKTSTNEDARSTIIGRGIPAPVWDGTDNDGQPQGGATGLSAQRVQNVDRGGVRVRNRTSSARVNAAVTGDDIRYSVVPDPNQPAPEAPDLGPNIFTEEASALAATTAKLRAKIKIQPAPKVAKVKADPNIEFTKGFIASWDRNSGKEKADAKPKEKIPAKEVISEFTSLPKKGKGYALTDTGRDAFLTALNQKLVNLGVPSDLAFEATRRAWATYSTKKQKNIDAKALVAAKKAIREQQSLAKKTAAQAQAAIDKPTNTAKDYLKPATAPKGPAVQDPVKKALRDAEKIPRIGAAFNSSPEARNAFMTGLSSKLISLGVEQQTAWAAANKAWSTYQTNLADKVTALRKDIEKNKMSSILTRELKKIPVYQQNDIQYVREYMKNILVFGGLAEDVADAAATLYLNEYVDLMKQTKVKTAEKFIESESGTKIKKKIAAKPNEYDKLMEAVRLGVTDRSFTAALAFTTPSKFQAFTQADHDRMVALEEEIQDPDTPNLIKVQKVNELMKLADSRMNDINALNVFTGYLVNNTLSGIGTAAIQVFTPFYSMGTRLATDGVRGLMTKDPQRFIASLYAVMDAADTVTAEFKYSFGNDVFRRGQQAELRTLTELRKVLDNNLKIYQTTTNGLEKVVAASKIALAAPDYVRRLYSAMDTASQSLFINQIKVVGIYDAMKKNGMSLKKFKDMLDAKRTFRDAYTITLHGQGGYTKNQIRLIAEDAAMNDFGEKVAAAIGQGGAETIADVYKMADLEGPSEIGVAESADGHVIPFLLDVLDSIKSSGDRAAGKGAGDLAFRLVVGYPTTALKVLNRSLYFFPPTAVVRMILNKRYENQADFDPEAPRKYEMLRTESQKHQRMAELVTGSLASIILMALIMDERDKEEKDRRFAVHNLGPSDRAAKQAWRAAGNVQQSIQWRASETSPWISVSWAKAGLESLAPVLALVGTVYDSRDEIVDEGKMADHALNVAGGVMGVFNRPLSGLNDIGEILSGEKNSISQKSLASYTAFRASGLVPFSSLLKTYNRTQGPRDMSTATSTMMSQIPIAGPSLTEPGINLFGDPLGATPNELTYKLPILPVQVGLRQKDVPFYEKMLSKGQYPPLKLRTTFEKTYGPVTDSVWRQYVEKRGQMVKKLIIDRWTDLDTLSPEIYDKVLGKFAEAADETVIQELKIQRVPKPVIK